jgi:hypothetical protein
VRIAHVGIISSGGERLDVRVWNDAADAMFDFSSQRTADQNILIFLLADERGRALFDADWAPEAKRMVSIFRTAYDQRLGDPAFEALAKRLNGRTLRLYPRKACSLEMRPARRLPIGVFANRIERHKDEPQRRIIIRLECRIA